MDESVEYSLVGSPLERTGDRSMRSYYSCVGVHFPDDSALAALDADGYIALPLVGTRDDIIGAILAITRRPLNNEAGAKSLLRLLAGRVAAELERARTERELRKNEHHLVQVQRVDLNGVVSQGKTMLARVIEAKVRELLDGGGSKTLTKGAS